MISRMLKSFRSASFFGISITINPLHKTFGFVILPYTSAIGHSVDVSIESVTILRLRSSVRIDSLFDNRR